MVLSLPPPLHTQPEREGLQGGMYRNPACSLKLNTEIIAKTHPGAFPQTRTTCIQKRGLQGERSDSWFTCTPCLKVKDDKYHLKKQLAVLMAHDQSISQALSIFHLQEKTKRQRDTTTHRGKML